MLTMLYTKMLGGIKLKKFLNRHGFNVEYINMHLLGLHSLMLFRNQNFHEEIKFFFLFFLYRGIHNKTCGNVSN